MWAFASKGVYHYPNNDSQSLQTGKECWQPWNTQVNGAVSDSVDCCTVER